MKRRIRSWNVPRNTKRLKSARRNSPPPPLGPKTPNAAPMPPRRVTRRTKNVRLMKLLPNKLDYDGQYRIVVHEGSNITRLNALHASFAKLCPKTHVGPGYIGNVLDLEQNQPVNSAFAITATHSRGTVGAAAHCTLYTRYPGVAADRIVFVDLVCADKKLKGVGAVLLAELERYAVHELGAHTIMLQSVLNDDTRSSYRSKGFLRGVGNRSPAALAKARNRFRTLQRYEGGLLGLIGCVDDECRKSMMSQINLIMGGSENDPAAAKAAHRNSMRKDFVTKQFMDALEGEFYPPFNKLLGGGDSIVMYKHLPRSNRSAGAVRWQGKYGIFTWPMVRVLAEYKRNTANGMLKKTT